MSANFFCDLEIITSIYILYLVKALSNNKVAILKDGNFNMIQSTIALITEISQNLKSNSAPV